MKLKNLVLASAALALTAASFAAPTFAAQPANPGCFGQDRAAYIHDVAQTDPTLPGAAEVGVILGDRAGDNGDMNRAYKDWCGG